MDAEAAAFVQKWYGNGEHYHCPFECEHPQPWEHNGELICGRCAAVDKVRTAMVLCTSETCPEEHNGD